MYETLRIVEQIKPKYVLWENVKNILSKKHRHNFDRYLEKMEKLGYTNYYQVLNAKDYGIPQNRERVFTISILRNKKFEFPPKEELKLRLKDLLENEVDEKYYLTETKIIKIQNSNFTQERKRLQDNDCCDTLLARDWKDPKCVQVGNLQGGKWDKINESCRRVYSENGLSPTIHTCQGGNTEPKIAIKNATKKGYIGMLIDIDENNKAYYLDCGKCVSPENIVKHSKNIIDLIGKYEFANERLIIDIDRKNNKICLLEPFDDKNLSNSFVVWHDIKEIKTIVTKEQFKQVQYEVNDFK